jgi:hypothetical protein
MANNITPRIEDPAMRERAGIQYEVNFHSAMTGNCCDIKMLQTFFTKNGGTERQALALLQYLRILADY